MIGSTRAGRHPHPRRGAFRASRATRATSACFPLEEAVHRMTRTVRAAVQSARRGSCRGSIADLSCSIPNASPSGDLTIRPCPPRVSTCARGQDHHREQRATDHRRTVPAPGGVMPGVAMRWMATMRADGIGYDGARCSPTCSYAVAVAIFLLAAYPIVYSGWIGLHNTTSSVAIFQFHRPRQLAAIWIRRVLVGAADLVSSRCWWSHRRDRARRPRRAAAQ